MLLPEVRAEVDGLIDRLQLLPHPEGGYYRETYRSDHELEPATLPAGYDGPRCLCTAIYYLLAGDQVSRLHRLHGDELWHHYSGSGLTLHLFDSEMEYRQHTLGAGAPAAAGAHVTPQFLVPAGFWFGATVCDPESYSLVGCTMSPGFEFVDFELATPQKLGRTALEQSSILQRLVTDGT